MMSRRFAWLASGIAAAGVAFAVSCATLEPLEAGVCGNGVLDLNEDCDPAQRAAELAAGNLTCVGNGDPHACRYTCGEGSSTCPPGWGCDLNQNICARPSGSFAAKPALETGAVRMVKGDFDGDGRTDLVLSQPSGLDGTSSATAYFFEDGMTLRERRRMPVPVGGVVPLEGPVPARC